MLNESNLVNVLAIIRHGVRNPGRKILQEYTGINNNPKELTVYGIRGSYETGRAFAQYYEGFLKKNEKEIKYEFFASAHERCILSSESWLKGFFLNNQKLYNKSIFSSITDKQNKTIFLDIVNCPGLKKMSNKA